MTFYCPIGQEMLNLVTNCCKLLKVNQAAERAVSSTVSVNIPNLKSFAALLFSIATISVYIDFIHSNKIVFVLPFEKK